MMKKESGERQLSTIEPSDHMYIQYQYVPEKDFPSHRGPYKSQKQSATTGQHSNPTNPFNTCEQHNTLEEVDRINPILTNSYVTGS